MTEATTPRTQNIAAYVIKILFPSEMFRQLVLPNARPLLFNGYSMDPSGGAHREDTQLRLCPHYLWSSGGCLS